MAGLQKILLVEDDPQITEIYTTVLQSQGYQVATAVNYDEAIMQAKDFEPDLVFLDVMIPGRSGLEVMRTLRSDPQYNAQNKKIVLLTNLGENDEVKQALTHNQADGFVIKADISADDLDDIIKSFDKQTAPPINPAGPPAPTPTSAPSPVPSQTPIQPPTPASSPTMSPSTPPVQQNIPPQP